ncbi:hypothetical protein [Sulfitobacter delicatus]|uniref:Uncharacterized protein n=1 Tax=Sulfitobacter delicatus TaxID=218672 RepID=A0A1G7NVU8_9RHOB|nr:hypothetical protein [Sulfitobacter delicatus]SDF78134.1 hypothetical protein SAMN04489759_103145 [Sulfitobacter delicatus]
MKNATTLFTDRIGKLEREIDRLRQERAMLYKFQRLLGEFPQALRDDDRFTPRTATKFELLARVLDYLNLPDTFIYGGASTKEIYRAVLDGIRRDRNATIAFNSHPQRLEREEERKVLTPLEANEDTLNYNTFRSYLARYRDEGRIFFNEETRRWRATELEVIAHTPEEEDERDRS